MGSLLFPFPVKFTRNFGSLYQKTGDVGSILSNPCNGLSIYKIRRSFSQYSMQSDAEDKQSDSVEDLRVPNRWSEPPKALEESEWLRVTLHKWLDDEYCPESTNIEISKVAARSYYTSLVERETDLGEILLKMARELESVSYQESFHGAYSSANAAVNLIIERIEHDY